MKQIRPTRWLLPLLALLLVGLATPPISVYATTTSASLQPEERPIAEVLEEISEKYQVFFTYDAELLKGIKVKFELSEAKDLDNAINIVMARTGLGYELLGNKYYVIYKDNKKGQKNMRKMKRKLKQIEKLEQSGTLSLQRKRRNKPQKDFENILQTIKKLKAEKVLTGFVKDTEGAPLIGANIVVKGTSIGTVSDIDGSFRLTVPDDASVLVVSYTGYITREVGIANQTRFDIALAEDIAALDEVIVVGYGTQGRGTVTSAIDKISSDEINTMPVVSATQAVQGRSAGLVVTNQGAPGQDPVIRIRGLTSPNTNNPLIVIDGIPAGGLNAINPNDVESIEVLKDASAAAIYGSRAAGGVILVTTKRGKSGAPKLTFDAYVGTQSIANRLDLLNTSEYIEIMTEQQTNGGLPVPPRFSDSGIRNVDIDYQDEVFRSSPIMNYSLGISGGTETSNYLFSLNYMNQQGIVLNNDFERYSVRLNSDYLIWNKVKVGQTLVMSYTESTNVANAGGRGLFEHVTKFAPYLSPREEGNLGGFNGPDQIDNNDAENPVRVLLLGDNNSRTLKALGSVFADVEIIKNLHFRTSVGMDLAFGRNFSFNPSFFDGEFHNRPFAELNENRTTFFSPLWTNTLSYNTSFGSHNIGVIAGYEVQDFTTETLGGAGINELTNDLQTPGSIDNDVVSGGTFEDGLVSYFGRLNYDYEGKYLLQAAIRRDGYSRFGPNNKWGIFPSVSVGWNIAREPFLNTNQNISNLKLRASWGRTGNNNALGRYEYQPTVRTGFTYNFGPGSGQVIGSTIPGLANEALKWETTTMTNIGFDLGLFEDAITLSTEYFVNTTEDILLSVPLASSLGLDRNVRVNAGDIESSGVEFTLGVQNRKNAFKWGVDANFATQDNEVISLGTGNPINGRNWQGDILTRVEEGQPIYFFQGWQVDRLFQSDDFNADGSLKDGLPSQNGAAPGDIKFMDIAGPDDENGNPTGPDGVIDANDRTNLGSPIPTYTFGLTGNFEYKNFDLSIFLQGVGGNKIFKAYAYWTQGMTRVFNGESVLLNRWTPTNTNTDVPRAVSGDPNRNARASDRFIDDGDYIRLKNVTLGYTLNTSNTQWLSSMRFYISAQNLLTFTNYEGYDPEVSVFQGANFNNAFGIDLGQLPQARTFIVGLQASF